MKKFAKLRPSQVGTDPRFQRDIDEGRVRSMAKKLAPDLLGVPVVSRRSDGAYVAIDGQHRLSACKVAEHDEPILCEVHEELTLQVEAELFLRLNGGRTAVHVFDKFKAELVAKQPEALEIASIVKAAGLRIAKGSGRNCVLAIQALKSVYHRGNLGPVLGVLVAWSEGETTNYFDSILIKSISHFLHRYPGADVDNLAKKLAPLAADRVISRIKRAQGAFNDVSQAVAACRVLRDIYNQRLSKKTQLPPPEDRTEAVAEAVS